MKYLDNPRKNGYSAFYGVIALRDNTLLCCQEPHYQDRKWINIVDISKMETYKSPILISEVGWEDGHVLIILHENQQEEEKVVFAYCTINLFKLMVEGNFPKYLMKVITMFYSREFLYVMMQCEEGLRFACIKMDDIFQRDKKLRNKHHLTFYPYSKRRENL